MALYCTTKLQLQHYNDILQLIDHDINQTNLFCKTNLDQKIV